ncbi:MAG: nicotinate (nicotinamide) nucleotide adenylyltransferase [Burkholderiales bacterium]|jgi:nicotinate-nucleotide adenylyltransferase|nr:nicotinate (nicotinamide) nucleotide adenylyltransferase [Burkholderiales bacterium]MBP7520371.1 nicotinate (nicotinamide) nucleotide adenylyltransferase [Leptothrix sp. (in: b-proteobacteria)]
MTPRPRPRPSLRRIGLLGGSFDPVHLGHRALADCALQQLQLDELRWVVAGQPWQKAGPRASAQHRAAMVAQVIADEPRYRLERCELEREGPSYMIDTVQMLKAATPAAEWFLILGEDQYANLPTWHRWTELLGEVTLAVAERDGRAPRAEGALAQQPHRLELLHMPEVPLSSTGVRQALAGGETMDPTGPQALAPAVADYILQHELYHDGPATRRADAAAG